MTPEQIIELAKKAGFHFRDAGYGPEILHTNPLEYSQHCFERFAQLVRNAALEEAAVACDNIEFEDNRQPYDAWTVGTMDCADKIRSLATTKVQMCACKDRPASQCPGEWEPNCDLGNNEQFAVPAERSSVFRYIDQQVQKEMAGFYEALGIPEPSTKKQNLEVVGEVVQRNDNGHPWKRISGLDW